MNDQIIVHAFGRGTINHYEPSSEVIRKINSKYAGLQPGTLRYEILDFIRIGLGLSSLDSKFD